MDGFTKERVDAIRFTNRRGEYKELKDEAFIEIRAILGETLDVQDILGMDPDSAKYLFKCLNLVKKILDFGDELMSDYDKQNYLLAETVEQNAIIRQEVGDIKIMLEKKEKKEDK